MINALRYTKDLEEAGFTKDQANTSLKVLVDIMDHNFATNEKIDSMEKILRTDMEKSGFALRTDLEKVETSIRADMRKMEQSLRSDMEKMEQSLRSDMEKMEQSLRSDMEKMEQSLRSDLKREILSVHHKIDSMSDKITIRMTGVLVVAMTALKYLG